MNERALAIDVLRRAHNELARRLTDRVLDSAEAILDDARGERYLSEIECVYDELGARLAHVSTLLAQLQSADEALTADEAAADADAESIDGAESDWFAPATIDLLPIGGRLALPPPRAATPIDPAAELRAFLRCVQRGDLAAAAARLAGLFELSTARAQRCADVFAVQAALRGEWYTRVMRLKGNLERGAVDEARTLLYDCFGLEPFEAVSVVQLLCRRSGLVAGTKLW